MGLFDTLLGRTKPVRANLDALFSLPSAAITLQVTAGLVPTGRAGVCFKPPAGQPFAEMQAELEQLLATPDEPALGSPAPAAPAAPATPGTAGGAAAAATAGGAGGAANTVVRHVGDKFGYRWIIVEASAVDDLVTHVHMVHSSLQDSGLEHAAAVLGLRLRPRPGPGIGRLRRYGCPRGQRRKRRRHHPASLSRVPGQAGTFYPFAPTGPEQRDNELELRIKGMLSEDLPIEPDLSRWFPMWDLPIA